jgi:hypothetical protein
MDDTSGHERDQLASEAPRRGGTLLTVTMNAGILSAYVTVIS